MGLKKQEANQKSRKRSSLRDIYAVEETCQNREDKGKGLEYTSKKKEKI